jgi:hypothetical protein
MRNAEYRLAALPFIAAIRLHLALLVRHLPSALRHLAFVICHLAFVICHPAFALCHLVSALRHLAFAICHLTFAIPRSEFPIPHSAQRVQRPQQLPRLGRLVPPVPLERLAAIERRAVGPIGVRCRFDGLVPGPVCVLDLLLCLTCVCSVPLLRALCSTNLSSLWFEIFSSVAGVFSRWSMLFPCMIWLARE